MTHAGITRWLAPGNDGSRYSSAVRHGDVIYVSGQLGTTSGAKATAFDEQLRLASRTCSLPCKRSVATVRLS